MGRTLSVLMALLPSAIRIVFLRAFCGAKVAKGAHIGIGCVLRVAELELGPEAKIGGFSYIRCRKLTMEKKAQIGALAYISVDSLIMRGRSTIGPRVDVVGGHDHNGVIELGAYSWIFSYCYINVTRPITLGRNVGIGGGSYLFTHGFWLSKLDGFPVTYGEIAIDDNTWLPWGCFVMPGVTIGRNVIVGARSVVTKSVPDDAVVAGIPAKVLRDKSRASLTQADKNQIFEELIRDYAVSRGRILDRQQLRQCVAFLLDSTPFVMLHDGEATGPYNDPVLHVFWTHVSDELLMRTPSWSLADYKSSPECLLTEEMRAFLKYARTIGLRYYPIDEQL
jgi:acetyltransferase-like isoleucine patch superfamily enzyme